MSRANEVNSALYGLSEDAGINNAQRARIAARYAALIDGMTARRKLDRVNSKLLEGARRQGFIDDTGALTDWAHEWRNGCPVDAVAFEAICGRAPVAYTAKQNAVFRNYPVTARAETQALMERNLIIVDGDALNLGDAPFYLLCMYKMRGHDWKTIEDAAHALRWGVEETRIRAERIEEAGYVLPFSHHGDAA